MTMDARDDATEIVNEWTLPSVQRTSVLVDLIAEALAARDRRIAELELERDEARDLYTATETQRGREVLDLGRQVGDLEERLRAAESRAARAEGLLRVARNEWLDSVCDESFEYPDADGAAFARRIDAFLATSAETEEE